MCSGRINSYDVIIVGGGPSAAGLLRGLLLRLLDDSSVERRLGGDFRIAVLERGTDNVSDDNFDDDADGVDHNDECKQLVDFKLPLSAVGGNDDDNCDRRIIAPSAAATTATTTMTTTGGAMQQQHNRQQNQRRGGRFDHSHPSTFHLSHWFNAAHYTSRQATDSLVVPTPIYLRGHGHWHHQDATNEINDDMKVTNNDNNNNFINTNNNNNNNNNTLNVSTPTPTVLHVTTPNGATNYRLLDIPMGCGWGGSTNIHAGLIMEPTPTPMMGAAGAAADNVDGDDFLSWPGRWKGGKLLRKSMQDVKTVLLMNTDNSNAATATTTGDDYNNKCSTPRCHEMMREENNQVNNKMSGNDEDKVDGTTNNCNNFLLFQSVITSSSSNGGKRVNYFSALVGSLIQEYPMLQQHVIFLPGTFVERILINRNTGSVWGVECCRHVRHHNFKDCYQRIIVKSKGEIVLCAGAIGSPALLLASGIGHEDDLHIAGIVPWYENDCHCQEEEEEQQQQHQQSSASLTSSSLSSHQLIRTLPVGHNLRDHVLLPRVFVTSPLSLCYWCKTTWSGIVPNNVSSYNTIQGILSLDLPVKDSNDHASIQLQLADGSQMDYMIPHFAAGAVRRHWPLFFPSVFDLTTSTCIPILQIFVTLFHLLRSFLRSLLRLPPFNWLVRHHMSAINVCLMNPQSVGKVTVVSTACQDDNNDNDDDDDDDVRDMDCQRIRIKRPRLSNCRVLIDPGYLTSSRDVDALWLGWCAASDIIKRHRLFVGCVEILPGTFMNILFSIFTLISYTTSRIAWLIGSHSYHDKNRNESSSSSSNSINDIPAWFSNYVAEFANPYYHWCGTCAMGGGEDDIVIDGKIRNNVNASLSSVVDENLCVRGIVGLRICDASVFPDSILAPTALTCAALGYVAASEIFDY